MDKCVVRCAFGWTASYMAPGYEPSLATSHELSQDADGNQLSGGWEYECRANATYVGLGWRQLIPGQASSFVSPDVPSSYVVLLDGIMPRCTPNKCSVDKLPPWGGGCVMDWTPVQNPRPDGAPWAPSPRAPGCYHLLYYHEGAGNVTVEYDKPKYASGMAPGDHLTPSGETAQSFYPGAIEFDISVDATMGEAAKLTIGRDQQTGKRITKENALYCGDIQGGEAVFENGPYGAETQWRTYTLCRAYCALGFEAADLTPQLQYWVNYRCRPDGHGELFGNTTSLECKEQKCELLPPEYAYFSREVRIVEDGISIRNETINHDIRRLLFGQVPCCANANQSQPVYDFVDGFGTQRCEPIIRTCVPMEDDVARGKCKAGTTANSDAEFTCGD